MSRKSLATFGIFAREDFGDRAGAPSGGSLQQRRISVLVLRIDDLPGDVLPLEDVLGRNEGGVENHEMEGGHQIVHEASPQVDQLLGVFVLEELLGRSVLKNSVLD